VRSKSLSVAKHESLRPFYLLLLYLFLEYGRPQDLLPFLSYLHLPAITIGLLGIFLVISGKLQFKDNQTILFFLLLCLMVVHGPIAVNNYWTLMIFLTMSFNFIVLLSLIHFVDNPVKFDKLVKTWVGIHIFLALVGVMKKGRGIGGFLGDENDLCMTLNMIIPFSFFLGLHSSGKKRFYFICLTCFFLFVIILTQSRGGFVGLVATGIYCWLRTKRKMITALVVAMLAIFAVLIAPPDYWKEVRSIKEEGTSKGTGAERVYTWKVGWLMFLDNPVMGVGQGNFPWVFREYEIEAGHGDEGFRGRSIAGRAAHSIYFTLLPELGSIGTFLFAGMILYNIKDLTQIKNITVGKKNRLGMNQPEKFYDISLALEGSMISYLVSGAFISILYYPNFWILTGFIIALKKIISPHPSNVTRISSS